MNNVETCWLAEAAARLRVSYRTAHDWLLAGRLEGKRVGGRWAV